MTERRRATAKTNPGGHSGDEHPADRGEATKPASTILRQEIAIGAEQLERPAPGLFLSAVSGGLDIGFGPMMMATLLSLVPDQSLESRLILSVLYAIGFIIVILGRSELFTEHTTLAVLPLLAGRTTLAKVARLWGVVYAGNLLGVVVFASLATPLGLGLGLFGRDDLARLASEVAHVNGWLAFGSAIAAGWMMGLISWLVTAARDTIGQIAIILLVAGSIAFLGLHHSIAGSIEVLFGVFGADLGVAAWLRFLAIATAGNAVGGVVMVALLKHGHVSQVGQPRLAAERA